MKVITKAEWNSLHNDYKMVKADGTKMTLVLTSKGTCLVPTKIKG